MCHELSALFIDFYLYISTLWLETIKVIQINNFHWTLVKHHKSDSIFATVTLTLCYYTRFQTIRVKAILLNHKNLHIHAASMHSMHSMHRHQASSAKSKNLSLEVEVGFFEHLSSDAQMHHRTNPDVAKPAELCDRPISRYAGIAVGSAGASLSVMYTRSVFFVWCFVRVCVPVHMASMARGFRKNAIDPE